MLYEVITRILEQDDERIFLVATALRRGIPLSHIHDLTKIDFWFLAKFKAIIDLEETFAAKKGEALVFRITSYNVCYTKLLRMGH